MSDKPETLHYTVKWFMPDKKLIKFNESAEDYTLSDKVAKFDHTKFGIKTGIKVDVSINGKEVTYLRKSENQEASKQEEKPKEEAKPKSEEKPSTDGATVHTLTVAGITATREVISFKEDTGTKWYQVPEELRAQFDTLDIKARKVVKVTFGKMLIKDTEKPSIATIEVVPEEVKENKSDSNKKESPESETSSDRKRNSTGDSIERQCALKAAGVVLASMIDRGTETTNSPEKVKALLRELAEEGIKFIQG